MKDVFWFQHDSNARNDVRLLELRAELGWEGYGLWWALIEQLRESADYRLSNDKLGGLAMGMGVPKKQLESLLALCFDLQLLDLDDGYFFAPALCRRMEAWDTKRAALAEAGKRGAARRWAGDKPADAEPVPPQSPPDSHPNSHPIGHPNAGPMAIREENIREEKSPEETTSSFQSEVGAPQEKKIGEVVEPLPENLPTAAGPGGPADVGTSVAGSDKPDIADKPDGPTVKLTKSRGGKPLLTGDLAELLNPGGLAERVQKMKNPFTQFEADALCAKYGTEAAQQIVKEMANYAKLTNNVSANLTAQKWLDKRQPTPTAAVGIPSYEGRTVHVGVVHPGSVQGRMDTVAQARAELLGQLPA